MIAKMEKGRGFRGALEYDLQAGKSALLETNLVGATPRAMAKEFGEVRALRPTLGKAVLHVALSVPPGEHLTDDQWRTIGHRYLEAMGFTDNQYVITRHRDTDHEHIHIVANRITFAGAVVSDSQDWKRQEALMREIERDYGLSPVTPSKEAARKAPTKGEIEFAARTGQASIKQRLQGLCDAAMSACQSVSDYIERLEAVGVDVIPTVQLNGAKVSGLMYRLDETLMKGSDLGKTYSPVGLAKRGVTYEQARDFAAVNRCREREARRELAATDRELAPSEGAERRRAGDGVRAFGASDGRAHGRDAGELGPTADAERPTDGRVSDAKPEHREHVAAQYPTDGRGQSKSERGDAALQSGSDGYREPSRVGAGVETLRADDCDRPGGRDSHTRIVALALGQASDVYPALQVERDRTAQAVQRQLHAFGVDRFDLGIRDGHQGKMMQRLWTPDEVLQHVAWLKRMNAQGNDIYVKPAGDHGLVLVDDLPLEALARLKQKGFNPAIVTETSPGNLQAWLKVSPEPLEARPRTVLARGFAQDFGGDLHSADAQHYGRLAGFTNQKPNRLMTNGLHPFVLLREWSGQVMAKARDLLEKADHFLDLQDARREQQTRLMAIHTAGVEKRAPWGRKTALEPVAEYRRQAQGLETRYGPAPDWSKLDWMIAQSMVASGQYGVDDVERAILGGSPNLRTRKPGHLEDYAHRTATNAWNDPTVQAQRAQNLARQEDRGLER